ncbi:hypothetical protein EXIGLDRAFT_840935 [Exidia glandulosa HHB12029]|uniref:Uncharacterized protein n=1 Tax=Exidia glandulosa HHB12029 TaxID=1314781 RepID=A0A165E7I0_EXIGL|nr:hypothetical protein EXIGLDRAFT_840935 [Exidia glandulosa HHB12029]
MMIGSHLPPQSGAEQSQSASSSSQKHGGTVTVSPIPQDPPTPGHRHIYLVSQCYQPGRSHWSLWIPSLQNPLIGRVIHVRGSVIRGFAVEFKDNHKFNIEDDSELYQFTHLGEVPATSLVDSLDPRVEGDVRDDYDIAAYALELPARDSVNAPEPLDDPIWNRPHPRFERCQEWTRRLIADLVADNKLPRAAVQAMDTATSYTDERGTQFAYNRFAPPYGIQ